MRIGDTSLGKSPTTDRVLDGLDRRSEPIRAVAEKNEVATRHERADGGLAGTPAIGNCPHLEIVAGDDAAKSQAPTKQPGEEYRGEGRR